MSAIKNENNEGGELWRKLLERKQKRTTGGSESVGSQSSRNNHRQPSVTRTTNNRLRRSSDVSFFSCCYILTPLPQACTKKTLFLMLAARHFLLQDGVTMFPASPLRLLTSCLCHTNRFFPVLRTVQPIRHLSFT